MTHIDNSNIFKGGVYADGSVTVPANTTYEIGTVLGRNATNELTAYTSAVETSTPLYILAQRLQNATGSAVTYDLVRLFDSGVVDKNGLIFVKSGDEADTKVLDALKTNNFRLVNVEEQAVKTGLAE